MSAAKAPNSPILPEKIDTITSHLPFTYDNSNETSSDEEISDKDDCDVNQTNVADEDFEFPFDEKKKDIPGNIEILF